MVRGSHLSSAVQGAPPQKMTLLASGNTFRDTYEIERFIGEGAFAEVYRVKHRFLGRQAMKLFKQRGMTLPEIVALLDEAILLSRIGHPNIVRVFDANVLELPDGIFGYFTMENVSGGSLDKFWRSFGQSFIPLTTTVEIMKQICRGVALAHKADPPIIHRDIKPQNILVGYETDGLRARISDFGLAKEVNPLTLLATSAGTLGFKAPEAFLDVKGDSCAGDVWALGTTMYLLLTDRLPVDIDPDLGWNNKKAFSKQIASPSFFNIQVDSFLDKVIMRCLEKDPKARYRNAGELLDALESWKPVAKGSADNSSVSQQPSKVLLGTHSPIDDKEGDRLTREALRIAKEKGALNEAADLMEEAFNKSPALRWKFADRVRLWRCGVSM